MKKVKWRWDMGCYIAFCPYCGEPAYLEDRCEFCGKEYKWREGRYRPREVVVGKYTVVQTSGNSIYITNNEVNRLVYHATCTKRLPKRKLKGVVQNYERLNKIVNGNAPKGKTITISKYTYKGATDERN